MSRFAVDFAGFILGAALVSAPACAVIHSFAREARPSGSGVHQGRGGLDAGRSYLGAQDAQPYRLTAGPHNGESLGQSVGSPGFECCSRNNERDGVGSTRGAEQRMDLAPARCHRCDDAPARRAQTNAGRWDRTLHKGVTLGRDRGFASESRRNGRGPSTGTGPAEVDAASVARSQGVRFAPPVLSTSQSVSLLKEARAGSFHPFEVTGYSHGCIMPRFGPEGPPRPMANGEWPVAGLHVAADRSMPFGTVLEAVYKGLPSRLVVGDRGRWIRGNRLDLFLRSCDEARAWGRRVVMARVVGGE